MGNLSIAKLVFSKIENRCFENRCFENRCFENWCFENRCFENRCFEKIGAWTIRAFNRELVFLMKIWFLKKLLFSSKLNLKKNTFLHFPYQLNAQMITGPVWNKKNAGQRSKNEVLFLRGPCRRTVLIKKKQTTRAKQLFLFFIFFCDLLRRPGT